MKKQSASTQIADLFRSLSQPTRVEILLAIGSGEACVCHLEAILKMRQAYISQHLMALRQAGVLDTRRDGRFVYYRLQNPQILDFIRRAAETAGVSADKVVSAAGIQPRSGCGCPKCDPAPTNGLVKISL